MKFRALAALFLTSCAVGFLTVLLGAQIVVWGLSDMGVSSGIWGPYFILSGVSLAITPAVTAAVTRKKHGN